VGLVLPVYRTLRLIKQGDHSSWKVMECSKTIFQAWKVMENSQGHGKSWRVVENDDDVLEFFVKMHIIHWPRAGSGAVSK